MRTTAVVLVAALTLGACADDGVEVGDDPLADDGLPADREWATCEELERALIPPPDGPLSDDPTIAEYQWLRAEWGLRSDADWTASVAAGEQGALSEQFGQLPLTEAEAAEFLGRTRDDGIVGAIRDYADDHPDTFGLVFIDHSVGGRVSAGFTDGLEAHQAELDELLGAGRVTVVEVPRSTAELDLIFDRVRPLMGGPDRVVFTLGNKARVGVVTVGVPVLSAEYVDPVLAVVAADEVCFEGSLPSEVVPVGPQLTEGDGWRLLFTEDLRALFGVGNDEMVVATSSDELGALWVDVDLPGDPPPIDFGEEIVWAISHAHAACGDPEPRFDGFALTGQSVVPVIVWPGPRTGCDDIGLPQVFVLAVERSALPSGEVTFAPCGECEALAMLAN